MGTHKIYRGIQYRTNILGSLYGDCHELLAVASIMKRFLVPVSTVSARNAWHNEPRSVTQKRQKSQGATFRKNWVGMCSTLPETLTLFQTKICDFPYPISELIKNLIPYFRPEALEPGA